MISGALNFGLMETDKSTSGLVQQTALSGRTRYWTDKELIFIIASVAAYNLGSVRLVLSLSLCSRIKFFFYYGYIL